MNDEIRRAILFSCDAIGVPFYSLTIHPKQDQRRPIDCLTVHCVKWGTKYGSRYVNNLFSMVKRNLPENLEFDFICHTDSPAGIHDAIKCRLFNPESASWTHWWLKGNVFQNIQNEKYVGKTYWNLYLDLDTIILGDLNFLLQLPTLSGCSFFTLNAEQLKCEGKCVL